MKITKIVVITKIKIEIVWLLRQIAFFDLFSLSSESFNDITVMSIKNTLIQLGTKKSEITREIGSRF